MPETLPVDPSAGASRDPKREARIEQLLLSGLDHYFAGKFEEAINIWTRVVFLERGHGRARAYIERARGAQAERQREHEELVHRGVAAYQAGDMETARTLLTQALAEGGPTDTVLAFLQRVNRFEVASEHGRSPASAATTVQPANGVERTQWLPTVLASVAIAVTVFVLALPIVSWIAELPVGGPRPDAVRSEPVPIVRSSEMLIARARTLHRDGRMKEALALLDQISVSDPLRLDADRARSEVQRDLLAAAGLALDPEKGPVR